jgi:hypothetical protein
MEEEVCPSGRERIPGIAATGRENAWLKRWRRISRSTSTCYRRPYEKKSEARLSPSARPVVSSELLGELRAGLSSGSLVERPGIGKARPRIRPPSGSAFGIWRMLDPDSATCGFGYCGDVSVVWSTGNGSSGRIVLMGSSCGCGSATQTYGVVSWTGSHAGRPAGTVEYGFRA